MAAKTRHKSKPKKSQANTKAPSVRRRRTAKAARARRSAVVGKAAARLTKPAARHNKASARPVKSPVRPAKAAAKPPKTTVRPRPDERGQSPESEGATHGMLNKKTTQRQGFKTGEFIVYPAHGVGQIMTIEEQEVAGHKLELFVINFVKDKMTLRVPTAKIAAVGMRKLAEPPIVKRALETLKGRARIKRTMWSRRAQEYEAKINSGNIVFIAEVVRDLYRSESQPEQSYSERQLYEAALDRLAREISAVQRITDTEAVKEIEAALAKGPRRGLKPADEVEAEAA
ncbi:MAG: CarD family transcriptional regulator [Rhodoplanes sp.]